MALTADQHSQIAKVYEYMVPPQQREAFAQKTRWFHMLARIAAKSGRYDVQWFRSGMQHRQ
jgi:hypothetical protein